ncbi:TPA: hypothetical protein ACPZCJ_004207 [Yersinia enterocolitica]
MLTFERHKVCFKCTTYRNT